MTAFSFVHTADLHLDSPFSTLGLNHPDQATAMRYATYEAYERVVQLCIEKQVDFLLVSGDIYDGADRSLMAQIKFRDGLKKLDVAGIRAFVVHGNHDPLDRWASSLDWPARVHVFGDQLETVEACRDGQALAVVQGISYPTRDERRNLSLLFKRTSSLFHVGLLHANVGADTGHESYAPCTLDDLLKPEMDYWALGHVHRRAILSKECPCIVYPGNTQGRNIRETGEKGCFLVTVSEEKGVELEFHPTDIFRWVIRELSITDLNSEQDIMNAFEDTCSEVADIADGRQVIIRILLKGRGPLYKRLHDSIWVDDLLGVFREIGMSYPPYIWVEQLLVDVQPEWDLTEWLMNSDFVGEILRYSHELLESSHFEERIKKDLSGLFEDSRVRRYIPFPDRQRLRALFKKAEEMCAEALHEEENP